MMPNQVIRNMISMKSLQRDMSKLQGSKQLCESVGYIWHGEVTHW